MPQIKQLVIDWVQEAWVVRDLLSDRDVSSFPSGGLLGSGGDGPSQLPCTVAARLRVTQETIARLLEYRVKVIHKLSPEKAEGAKDMYGFHGLDPDETLWLCGHLVHRGVKFTSQDYWAISAHRNIGQILLDGYASEVCKSKLPLIIASISGKSASEQQQERASAPRNQGDDKTKLLRREKFYRQGLEPDATYKQLLQHLEGDGIVTYWDAKFVKWRDEEDAIRTTATATFRNWKKPPSGRR